jgi:hypothetical protein
MEAAQDLVAKTVTKVLAVGPVLVRRSTQRTGMCRWGGVLTELAIKSVARTVTELLAAAVAGLANICCPGAGAPPCSSSLLPPEAGCGDAEPHV